MELRKEEKIMLKSNLELISDWVDTINADIRDYIRIPIYHKDYDITFTVDKKCCYLRVGNSAMYLTNKDDDGSDKYYYLKLLSLNTSHAMHFLSNWKVVRDKIEKEIDLQRKALDNLNNFQL